MLLTTSKNFLALNNNHEVTINYKSHLVFNQVKWIVSYVVDKIQKISLICDLTIIQVCCYKIAGSHENWILQNCSRSKQFNLVVCLTCGRNVTHQPAQLTKQSSDSPGSNLRVKWRVCKSTQNDQGFFDGDELAGWLSSTRTSYGNYGLWPLCNNYLGIHVLWTLGVRSSYYPVIAKVRVPLMLSLPPLWW